MLLAYAASCALFALTFERLHVVDKTRRLLASLRASFAIFTDKSLTDLEKERALQRDSLRAAVEATKLTFYMAVTLAMGAMPILIGTQTGLFTFESFVMFSLEPLVLILTCVVFGLLAWSITRFKSA